MTDGKRPEKPPAKYARAQLRVHALRAKVTEQLRVVALLAEAESKPLVLEAVYDNLGDIARNFCRCSFRSGVHGARCRYVQIFLASTEQGDT